MQVGGPGNDFPHPVRSRAGRLRDEFQNDDNNDSDVNPAPSAAVVSIDAAGSHYVVAEQQPIAGPSCV